MKLKKEATKFYNRIASSSNSEFLLYDGHPCFLKLYDNSFILIIIVKVIRKLLKKGSLGGQCSLFSIFFTFDLFVTNGLPISSSKH